MNLQQELGQIIMMLHEDFQHRLTADLQRRGIAGIRARHRAVFLHLGSFGPSRSVDLAEAAGIRPQSMMKIIHELEASGWLERRPDPADSRAKLVDFTAQGRSFITELTRSTEAVWDQYASQLGERKMTAIFSELRSLIKQE